MSSDVTAQAIQFVITTTANSVAIEAENNKIKSKFTENSQFLAEYEAAASRAGELKKNLDTKVKELEQVRAELIETQAAIISTLQVQQNAPPQQNLEVVPVVVNRIQQFVGQLTDAAAENGTIAIPIFSVFKVNDSLNQLYDTLVQAGAIEETEEERETRIRNFVSVQQKTLANLKQMLAQAEEMNNVEAEEEEIVDNAEEDHPEEESAQEKEAEQPAEEEPKAEGSE